MSRMQIVRMIDLCRAFLPLLRIAPTMKASQNDDARVVIVELLQEKENTVRKFSHQRAADLLINNGICQRLALDGRKASVNRARKLVDQT